MGIIIRQGIKSSIVLYLGVAIGILSRLFLLTKYLSPEQIGFVDTLLYMTTILGGLFNFGLSASIPRFYDYFEKVSKERDYLGFIIKGMLVGMLLSLLAVIYGKGLILSIFSKNTEILSTYYYLLIPLILLSIVRIFFSNYALAKQRTVISNICNELLVKIGSVLTLILIAFGFLTFRDYVYMYVFVYFVSMVLLWRYVIRGLNFSFKCRRVSLSQEDKRKVLSFSSFAILSSFSTYCFQYIDTMMLGAMKGFTSSGIYSIAFLLGTAIELPRRAITAIAYPILVQNFNGNNIRGVEDIYKKSSINQGIVGGGLLVLIWINIDHIFYFIPDYQVYKTGKYVVLLIGASRLIDMLMGVNAEVLRASSKYRIDLLLVSCMVLITIGANYFLIPKFGLNGTALATLISVFAYNLARFLTVWKFFKISPFEKKTIYLIVIVLLFIGVETVLPKIECQTFLRAGVLILSKTMVFGGGMIWCCYRLKFSEDFNNILNQILNKVFSILKNKKIH